MTLTTLLAAIRRQTSLTTADVSDADVTAIINEGIQEIAGLQRWDFLYKKDQLDTTADTAEISLPADFKFLALVQQVGSGNGPLIQLSFDEYAYRFGDNATTGANARYFYLRFDNGTAKIGLYPTPVASVSDAYDIYYYKAPTELSAGGDSPQWDATLHNILVEYAAYRLWEREEYFEEAERAFRRYGRRLADMNKFYKLRGKVNRLIIGGGAYFGGHRDIRRHYGWE